MMDWRNGEEHRYTVGAGRVERDGARLRLVVAGATDRRYSDAQIDDYRRLPRRRFPHRPGLRLTVRARFSHPAGELRGTAGFGFWNDPFLMTGLRPPTLPRAAWFFYASPPSEMKLDRATPGHGWKAATLDALRPVSIPLLTIALPAAVLMNIRPLYRRLWPTIQRALHIREALLPVEMTAWHTYTLSWGRERVRFAVDGEPVLDGPAPHGPLGFVMWLDNQYLVATPWGKFRWGLLAIPGVQWMEVAEISLTPTSP